MIERSLVIYHGLHTRVAYKHMEIKNNRDGWRASVSK
jgi:hypothetical protein